MIKKLTKHGNSVALVIDKPILKLLHIDENTELELSIENNTLLVRASTKKTKPKKKEKKVEDEIREIGKKFMKKYHDVFKKLAKT